MLRQTRAYDQLLPGPGQAARLDAPSACCAGWGDGRGCRCCCCGCSAWADFGRLVRPRPVRRRCRRRGRRGVRAVSVKTPALAGLLPRTTHRRPRRRRRSVGGPGRFCSAPGRNHCANPDAAAGGGGRHAVAIPPAHADAHAGSCFNPSASTSYAGTGPAGRIDYSRTDFGRADAHT